MTASSAPTERGQSSEPLTVDGVTVTRAADLRLLTHEQLQQVFSAAPEPETLTALDGDPAGLGIRAAIFRGSRLERGLMRYAQNARFIWHGKGFDIDDDGKAGWGYNRFGIGPLLNAFPFEVRIGRSLLDGRRAVLLNFDVARNPFWERHTWDELREVIPGVYMGPTGQRFGKRVKTLAWFAVDTTTPVDNFGASRSGRR